MVLVSIHRSDVLGFITVVLNLNILKLNGEGPILRCEASLNTIQHLGFLAPKNKRRKPKLTHLYLRNGLSRTL
jgi:hypothetical protein